MRDAAIVFVGVCAAYLLTMAAFGHLGTSPVSYFNLLATSFIHGHTNLIAPPSTADLAQYQGRWYVPFPPLPALLMIPELLVWSTDSFNVGVFVGVVGSGAAAVVFLILEEMSALGLTRLTRLENLILTMAFAFGSIAWYMSTTSNVWFVAQVSTYLCALIGVLCVLKGWSPLLAGAAVGLAAAGRPHAIAVIPLLVALRRARGGALSVSWILKLLAPLGIAGAGLAVYNAIRFGNPADFGYQYALRDDQLGRDFRTYGQLSLHYLPHNLYAMFLELPRWNAGRHMWTPDPDGMSVVLTMPFIAWITRAQSQWKSLAWIGWASLIAGLVAPLLYYNSGFFQFGPRFWLDVMPVTVILVALGVRSGLTAPFRAVVVLSILINAAGVVWWHWPRPA